MARAKARTPTGRPRGRPPKKRRGKAGKSIGQSIVNEDEESLYISQLKIAADERPDELATAAQLATTESHSPVNSELLSSVDLLALQAYLALPSVEVPNGHTAYNPAPVPPIKRGRGRPRKSAASHPAKSLTAYDIPTSDVENLHRRSWPVALVTVEVPDGNFLTHGRDQSQAEATATLKLKADHQFTGDRGRSRETHITVNSSGIAQSTIATEQKGSATITSITGLDAPIDLSSVKAFPSIKRGRGRPPKKTKQGTSHLNIKDNDRAMLNDSESIDAKRGPKKGIARKISPLKRDSRAACSSTSRQNTPRRSGELVGDAEDDDDEASVNQQSQQSSAKRQKLDRAKVNQPEGIVEQLRKEVPMNGVATRRSKRAAAQPPKASDSGDYYATDTFRQAQKLKHMAAALDMTLDGAITKATMKAREARRRSASVSASSTTGGKRRRSADADSADHV